MKILTHDSLKAAGGINRRVRELKKRVNDLQIILTGEETFCQHDGQAQIIGIDVSEVVDLKFPYEGIESEEDARSRFMPLVELYSQVIRKNNPDVALIMGTFFIPWALMHACKKESLPFVHLYIGSASTEFYPEDSPLKEHYFGLEQDFLDTSEATIFNSETMKKRIEELFSRLPKNYKIVYNGVPEEFFNDIPFEDREGFIYVARFDYFKNPQMILNAHDLSEEKFSITAVTNMDETYEEFEELSKRGFRIVPQTKSDFELRMLLQNHRGLISPSKFESFGNVSLESLAAGIPAITSKGIGAAEVFRILGLEHLLFDPNSTSEFLEKVSYIFEENPIIDKVSRNRLYELCNWDAAISQYISMMRRNI